MHGCRRISSSRTWAKYRRRIALVVSLYKPGNTGVYRKCRGVSYHVKFVPRRLDPLLSMLLEWRFLHFVGTLESRYHPAKCSQRRRWTLFLFSIVSRAQIRSRTTQYTTLVLSRKLYENDTIENHKKRT